jgi:hypothetical protein
MSLAFMLQITKGLIVNPTQWNNFEDEERGKLALLYRETIVNPGFEAGVNFDLTHF